MTETTLTNNDGKTTIRTGTSGFTVTAQRDGVNLSVLMEFDQATLEEGVAMVATVLTQLEEMYGEAYVAAICGHYAEDTGKKFFTEGDHKVGIIRGGNRGKPPRKKR
jgi:hypothetical protein